MFLFFLTLVIAVFTAEAMKRGFIQRVVATTVAGSLSFLPVTTVLAESNLIPTTIVVDKREKYSIGMYHSNFCFVCVKAQSSPS